VPKSVAFGATNLPADAAAASSRTGSSSGRALSNPSLHRIPTSAPPASKEAIDIAVGGLEKLLSEESPSGVLRRAVASEAGRGRKSNPPVSRKARTPATPSAAARPAAVSSKPAQSIFGDGVISEKSLDEVILSYLAEDLDGSSSD
jgi:hypothetical protein